EGAFDNSVLAALPAIHPQADYTPPDPTAFLISGTVLRNGAPLAGATVQLSGPVSASATTDSNGAYRVFFQHPTPGHYPLTGSLIGYVFSAPLGIHIDGPSGSSRNNDLTATLQTPVITSVQPNGIVAGSGPTTLVVTASPVTPNGQIIFDGKPLVTTAGSVG